MFIALSGIWSSIEERCSRTVRQRCYSCDKADSEEKCNEDTEVCSDHEQMCEIYVGVSGADLQYSKGCIKPSECQPRCNAFGCTQCCIGDKCNDVSKPTDAGETKVCDIAKATDCTFKLLNNLYHNKDKDGCKVSYSKLDCMLEYTKDCHIEKWKEISKSSSKIVEIITKKTCPVVTSEQCNSAAIFSFQSALSNPYVGGKAALCRQRQAALDALQSLSDSPSCSVFDLIGIRQTLKTGDLLVRDICLTSVEQCNIQLDVDVSVSISVRGNDMCSREMVKMATCLTSNIKKLKAASDNSICSETMLDKCLKDVTASCNIPESLKRFRKELSDLHDSVCNTPTVTDCSVSKTTRCDVAESLLCTQTLQSDSANFCQRINFAQSCVSRTTSGCLSVQEVSPVESFNKLRSEAEEKCLPQQLPAVIVVKTDVYTDYSKCLQDFSSVISTVFERDDFMLALCKGFEDSDTCIENVWIPALAKPFVTATVNRIKHSMSSFTAMCASDGIKKREANVPSGVCDLKKASSCLGKHVLVAQTLPVLPFSDHMFFCGILSDSKKCVEENIAGCPSEKKDVMVSFIDAVKTSISKYCVPLIIADSSCDMEYAETCVETFTLLSSYSTYSHEQICRNAEVTLECVRKFTTNCSDVDQGLRVQTHVKTIIRSVIGNNCPTVTARLFCDEDVHVVKACQVEDAGNCFGKLEREVGNVMARILDNDKYCRVITENWKCLQDSVQGCTKSLFDSATQSVTAGFLSQVKASGCFEDSAVIAVPDKCIAEPTCSLDKLYTCIDDFLSEAELNKMSACSSAESSRDSCFSTFGAGCTSPQIVIVLAHYNAVANKICDKEITATETKPELICLTGLVDGLITEILSPTTRGLARLCGVFNTYSSCFDSNTFMELGDVISKFYGKSGNFLSDFISGESLCKQETTDIVGIIDIGKSITAVNCVVRQISSVVIRRLIPLSDKEVFCSTSKSSSYLDSCLDKITGLTSPESEYLQNIKKFTSSFSHSAEFCEMPELCIVQESSICLQTLETEIAKYEMSGSKDYVCSKIVETKNCMKQFSNNCGLDGADIVKKFNMAKTRVESICSDVLPPICDNIMLPACDMVDALECMTRFNAELLSHQSVVWRDMCTELQHTVQCVAHSISTCNRNDIANVIKNMGDLKNGIGRRCPWIGSDVCGKPCPIQSANCVSMFKYELISGSDKDVCTLFQEAEDCINKNTKTCPTKQQELGIARLHSALDGLNLKINCDSSSSDSCLVSFQSLAVKVVSSNPSDNIGVCQANFNAMSCIANSTSDDVLSEVRNIMDSSFYMDLQDLFIDICSGITIEDSCKLKSAIKSTVDFMASTLKQTTFNEGKYCSEWRYLQRDITADVTSCSDAIIGKLSATIDLLGEGCNVLSCDNDEDKIKECIKIYTNVKDKPNGACAGVYSATSCIISTLSGCGYSVVNDVLKASLPFVASCPMLPSHSLSVSTSKTIYLLEGGPSFPISLKMLQNPGNTELKIKVKNMNTGTSPPKCSDTESDYAQVVVNLPNCGHSFTQNNYETPLTFDLSAMLDGRVDGTQNVVVVIQGELIINNQVMATLTLAEYNVVVQDRDSKTATCSSINDPHIKTFDNLLYNNMLEGIFILYQHQTLPFAVHVTNQKCAKEGTCNCRIQIKCGDDVLDFNRCHNMGDDKDVPKLLDLSLTQTNDFTAHTKIFSHDEGHRFYVLLPTGTVVQIKLGDFYLNVWITPSVLDIGKTEGLCGLYNGNMYDDLLLPSGENYVITDEEKNSESGLNLNGFSEAWRIRKGSADDLSVGVEAYTFNSVPDQCKCESSSTCGQSTQFEFCGLIQGEDITDDLVTESKLFDLARSRRKRAVINNIDIDETAVTADVHWPTSTGWTLTNATSFCQDSILRWDITQKCLEAITVVGGKTTFETEVNNCVEDIKRSGNTNWVSAAKDDVLQNCLNELNKDVQYQNDPQAKLQADAVMSSSCNPSDCNGNGQCIQGTCRCSTGYYGSNCSMSELELPTPVLYSITNQGECIFTNSTPCTNVFINGKQFIQSEKLTCHIQPIRVTETGFVRHGEATNVIARIITANQVNCQLSDMKARTTSLQLSISNDGQSASNAIIYIAFNTQYHDCDANRGTCRRHSDVCEINENFYKSGAVLSGDDCLYCDPEKSQTEWTSKSKVGCQVIVEKQSEEPSGLGSTEIVIIGVFGGVVFFIVIAIIVKLAVMKQRNRRPDKQVDTELAQSTPPQRRNQEIEFIVNTAYISHSEVAGVEENIEVPRDVIQMEGNSQKSASETCSVRLKTRLNTNSLSNIPEHMTDKFQ